MDTQHEADELAALNELMAAYTKVFKLGSRAAARQTPNELMEGLDNIRRHQWRPELRVAVASPTRITMLAISPDGQEFARLFEYEVAPQPYEVQ